jgi:predicted enzyme related to lactoylglutathione lyase
MGTRFVWNELNTPDQEICGEFLSQLLGWKQRKVDMGPHGTYTLFDNGDGEEVAGMMNPATEHLKSLAPVWVGFVEVDDVDAYAERVTGLGGTVVAPPADIPEVGRACTISDPLGAPICLMTSIRKPSSK